MTTPFPAWELYTPAQWVTCERTPNYMSPGLKKQKNATLFCLESVNTILFTDQARTAGKQGRFELQKEKNPYNNYPRSDVTRNNEAPTN